MSPRAVALYLIRALGGFTLAQRLTRKQLRVLCYHGFAIGDEYEVAPYMFMRAQTFERRMQILKRRGVAVVSLDQAVRQFTRGEIRNAETVITLDDGWASNLTIGLPILKKYGYPACIYITTEHLAASTEVFNVVLTYMLQRTSKETLTLQGVHPALDGVYPIRKNLDSTARALIAGAESAFPLAERQRLLAPLAAALGLDIDEVMANGRFRLLEPHEIRTLFDAGIDIQLHTHTHRLPCDSFEAMQPEIEENRKAVKQLIGREQNHFCFPSGVYDRQHPQWLARLGIASATTCDPGFNGPNESVLLLKRYLDNEYESEIEFEAEVAGVRELARKLRDLFLGNSAPPIAATASADR
jgi:peptidoglycan/xylan/chitin deacetylase (PgdA/CDA1 family)